MIRIKKLLQISSEDNVAIALVPLRPGEKVAVNKDEIEVRDKTPQGHKLAVQDIKKGALVIRYGYPIGVASTNISVGQWVHSHNLKTSLKGKEKYEFNPVEIEGRNKEIKDKKVPVFKGYYRENGEAGIRNELWIINTVGCINKVTEKIAQLANQKFRKEIEDGVIDGIYSFSHPYGCSQLGEDLIKTQKILAGLVQHPNAAGVLVVGLGCENNQMEDFQKFIPEKNSERIKYLVMQDIEDEIEKGLELLKELIEYAKKFKPEEIPVSELVIGLKCGGSDSFSGITANPLVGRISDIAVNYGGSAILTEVPEMFGAETILMNRARDVQTFNKITALINNFKDYFIKNGQEVYENPSPGNKEGGITTLEEKSLGCIFKGGVSPVVDVLKYGDRVREKGLNLLESPGNDIVSTTALTAAGAHLILFTTGRGNPMGAPVPTVKIASNSSLYEKKKNWIDFDAGQLLKDKSVGEVAGELFELLLGVAGKRTLARNEINGYRDIAIFKTGVTL